MDQGSLQWRLADKVWENCGHGHVLVQEGLGKELHDNDDPGYMSDTLERVYMFAVIGSGWSFRNKKNRGFEHTHHLSIFSISHLDETDLLRLLGIVVPDRRLSVENERRWTVGLRL